MSPLFQMAARAADLMHLHSAARLGCCHIPLPVCHPCNASIQMPAHLLMMKTYAGSCVIVHAVQVGNCCCRPAGEFS